MMYERIRFTHPTRGLGCFNLLCACCGEILQMDAMILSGSILIIMSEFTHIQCESCGEEFDAEDLQKCDITKEDEY